MEMCLVSSHMVSAYGRTLRKAMDDVDFQSSCLYLALQMSVSSTYGRTLCKAMNDINDNWSVSDVWTF